MEYIIYIFIIASIPMIFYGSWGIREARNQILQRLPALEAFSTRKTATLKKFLAPVFKFSDILLERLKLKQKYHQKLFAAHLKLTPAEFFAIKLTAMALLGSLFSFVFKKFGPGAAVLGVVFGYYITDIWVSKRIAKRRHSITRLLPETVDLVGLCMEAGLDFTTAMDWIVKKTRPTPMVEELAFVVEEIRWGKPRIQALKDMANRLDLAEIRSFVHTLAQAERMGTPVLEVLGMLSEDSRIQRFHRGERIALKAPIKMLIPLIFCILPVIFIIVA
ncbi:MAG: type II secretion system F family protein, partial [Candidatus Omnitrophica bacterium]|nr:type II secretion system F family protein [Candidatus Omnitrophota bacterium]